jgi:hypothetical protein
MLFVPATPTLKGKTMLIRIEEFVFNTDNINFIKFDDNNKNIDLFIGQNTCSFNMLSESEKYTKIKEFLLAISPNIATEIGREGYFEEIEFEDGKNKSDIEKIIQETVKETIKETGAKERNKKESTKIKKSDFDEGF